MRMCVFFCTPVTRIEDGLWGWVLAGGIIDATAQMCWGLWTLWTLLQDKNLIFYHTPSTFAQNHSKIHDSDHSTRFSPKTSLDKPVFSLVQHMTFLHGRSLRSCTRSQVPARMTCCRLEKDLLVLFWNAASTAANAYCKTRMSILPYPQSLYARNYASCRSLFEKKDLDVSNNICAHTSHLKFQNTPRILAWIFCAQLLFFVVALEASSFRLPSRVCCHEIVEVSGDGGVSCPRTWRGKSHDVVFGSRESLLVGCGAAPKIPRNFWMKTFSLEGLFPESFWIIYYVHNYDLIKKAIAYLEKIKPKKIILVERICMRKRFMNPPLLWDARGPQRRTIGGCHSTYAAPGAWCQAWEDSTLSGFVKVDSGSVEVWTIQNYPQIRSEIVCQNLVWTPWN